MNIDGYTRSELFPEELESFFISWRDRIPQKSLSLIVINDDFSLYNLYVNEENAKIIEKYKELGVIKKFGTERFDEI